MWWIVLRQESCVGPGYKHQTLAIVKDTINEILVIYFFRLRPPLRSRSRVDLGEFFSNVAESPNLMPPRSACLQLDTKHPKENTKLLGSIGHTPWKNPKIHIFAIRITNEIIKLTSFWTFLTSRLIQPQSITLIIITAEYNHIIRVMNNLIEQRNINMWSEFQRK